MGAIKQGRYNSRYKPHRTPWRPDDCEKHRPVECVIPFPERIERRKTKADGILRIHRVDHAHAGNIRQDEGKSHGTDVET